jgi:membrane protein DedA with SNARE-associated domain
MAEIRASDRLARPMLMIRRGTSPAEGASEMKPRPYQIASALGALLSTAMLAVAASAPAMSALALAPNLAA